MGSCVTLSLCSNCFVKTMSCDSDCVDTYQNQIRDLEWELGIYKPVLLALTTALVCIAIWLTVLTFTGKRRDKIRRLLRREQFVSEIDDTSSQDVGSICSVDKIEPDTKQRSKSVSVPTPVRSGKISLPARMTDLYQSYPDDADGITIPSVPEIVLTRPSIVSECSGENSSRQSENSNN